MYRCALLAIAAIVSAVIVPTPADLALGTDFGSDWLYDEEGCHRANSTQDFGPLALRSFHKAMVECFATSGSTRYMGLQTGITISTERVKHVSASLFSSPDWLLSGPCRRMQPFRRLNLQSTVE
jgi:hypothetical protein